MTKKQKQQNNRNVKTFTSFFSSGSSTNQQQIPSSKDQKKNLIVKAYIIISYMKNYISFNFEFVFREQIGRVLTTIHRLHLLCDQCIRGRLTTKGGAKRDDIDLFFFSYFKKEFYKNWLEILSVCRQKKRRNGKESKK